MSIVKAVDAGGAKPWIPPKIIDFSGYRSNRPYQKRKGFRVSMTDMGRAAERLQKALSYSQAHALKAIVKSMQGDSGVLVAKDVADSNGLTRSVIAGSLRLAEAAGLVETRSLGMKGTHINILNRDALLQAVGEGSGHVSPA